MDVTVSEEGADKLAQDLMDGYETYLASHPGVTFSQYMDTVSYTHLKVGNKVGNKKGLNARRQRIITEMRDNPNITTSELHQILGISETAVEKNLTFLKENGYVERVGSKKTGYWKVLE